MRQVETCFHWLTVMSSSQVVEAKDLPPEVLAAAGSDQTSDAIAPHTLPINLTNALMPEDAGLQPDLGRGLQAETATWLGLLAQEAQARLLRNEPAVMATLTRDFERILLETALDRKSTRLNSSH